MYDDEMFYGEDSASYHPDADHEIESQFDDIDDEWYDEIDDPSVEVDFWDWADIIGVVDEFVPQGYI